MCIVHLLCVCCVGVVMAVTGGILSLMTWNIRVSQEIAIISTSIERNLTNVGPMQPEM